MIRLSVIFNLFFVFSQGTLYDVEKYNYNDYDNDPKLRELIESQIDVFKQVKPYYGVKVVSEIEKGPVTSKIIYSSMDDNFYLHLLNLKKENLISFLELSRYSEDEFWQFHSTSLISNDTIYHVSFDKNGLHWEENAELKTEKINTIYTFKNGLLNFVSSDTIHYKEKVKQL